MTDYTLPIFGVGMIGIAMDLIACLFFRQPGATFRSVLRHGHLSTWLKQLSSAGVRLAFCGLAVLLVATIVGSAIEIIAFTQS